MELFATILNLHSKCDGCCCRVGS